jgi:hypothetical protein
MNECMYVDKGFTLKKIGSNNKHAQVLHRLLITDCDFVNSRNNPLLVCGATGGSFSKKSTESKR